jgi:hypothetical protein
LYAFFEGDVMTQSVVYQPKTISDFFQPAIAWVAIIGFVLITSVGLVAKAGSILYVFFPAGAFLVSIILYFKAPVLYIGFTWWLMFLTPWVRRMVDLSSGFRNPSPILLAPNLALLLTAITFFRYAPRMYRHGGMPFLSAFVGVGYAFLIGFLSNSLNAVLLGCLAWLTPIFYAFHLFFNWQEYPVYREHLRRVFLWGLLITGGYGIIQYLIAPAWDTFWIKETYDTVFGFVGPFGQPEPLQIRVFSTMASPRPFAVVAVAGLILLMDARHSLVLPASIIGYLALLLSLVRGAWVGWIASTVYLFTELKLALKLRFIVILTILGFCLVPLTAMEQFSGVIQSRLSTLVSAESVQDDDSFQARKDGYDTALLNSLSNPVGYGLGFELRGTSLGPRDSAILDMFFSLGWLGGIPYLGSIVLLIFQVAQPSGTLDTFASMSKAIAFGVLVQFPFGNSQVGSDGIIFWGFAAMTLAAQKYYHPHNQAVNPAPQINPPQINPPQLDAPQMNEPQL